MSKKKILIIDDEKNWRELFKMVLTPYNVDLCEAIDGRKGIELAKIMKPDIIILDNKMPNMTGQEAARLFRGELTTNKTPIIMVTAMEFSDSMIDYIKMDVHEFIKKPFDAKELLEKIEKLAGPIQHSSESVEISPEKMTSIVVSFDKKESRDFVYNRLPKNYNIIEAKDSADLLEKAIKENPDTLIVNAKTAGWSGYQGTKLLQNSLLNNISVVLDLGDSDSSEINEVIAKTGKRFLLLRPFATEDFEKQIKLLNKKLDIL